MNRFFSVMIAAIACSLTTVVAAQTENAQTPPGTAAQPAPAQPAPAQPAPAQPASAQPAPAVQPAPAAQPQYTAPAAPQPDPYMERLAYREAIRNERLKRRMEAKRSGRPLIMSGAITLGVGYAVSVVIGGILLDVGEGNAAFMFIPLAGNPIYLSTVLKDRRLECEDDPYDDYEDDTCSEGNFAISLALLTPALAQLAGTVLLSLGIVKRANYKRQKGASVALVPITTRHTKGLAFSMTF